MNKAFYIAGIVLSVIFFFVCAHYITEVDYARFKDFQYYLDSLDSYNYVSYSSISTEVSDLTMEAGTISLLFFAAFIAIDILGLIKVKTKTTKVFSIIGLSITFIFILWDFAVLSSPSALAFDEVGAAWLLYCFVMLAFCIVGTVQSFRYSKKQSVNTI